MGAHDPGCRLGLARSSAEAAARDDLMLVSDLKSTIIWSTFTEPNELLTLLYGFL
jgi:hypothetical protein